MQAFKTAIVVGGLAALVGFANGDKSSIAGWDQSPICSNTQGWQPWPDSRCNVEVAGIGDKDKRIRELEGQLAERDAELVALRGEYSAEMAKLSAAQRRLIPALRPEIENGDITVGLNNERLLINLSSAYLFGSGQDELKPAGADALKRVGAVLKDFPEYKVSVDGHTDNVPIQGALQKRFPTNKELSEARAANAAKALTEGGLGPAMTHGYADTKPIEPNTTDAGRAKNRRVEVRVTK